MAKINIYSATSTFAKSMIVDNNSKARRNVLGNITFLRVHKRFKFIRNFFSALYGYHTRSWIHSVKKLDVYGNPILKVTHQSSTTIPSVYSRRYKSTFNPSPVSNPTIAKHNPAQILREKSLRICNAIVKRLPQLKEIEEEEKESSIQNDSVNGNPIQVAKKNNEEESTSSVKKCPK
ncbi:unnamed protein product [Lepeophtheirus salmonis]|uniref:(salmon louse) hypothetical protein n=1 Tax=Lepeophtheirus salmonis TaxID=72036 RepID=A0A7R8CMJ6_LEPSM|nr:unnamed protein product [Lepeophtheirus salmonis]CAF2822436.1 unnamed protein product [Lepeophtheirus salmonis]